MLHDDAAVFAAVIAWQQRFRVAPLLVVRQSRTRSPLPPQEARGLPAELVSDWRRRNRKSSPLPTFSANAPLRFIDRGALDELLRRWSWSGFHRRYPGVAGFVSFSLPGYDADRSAALVYAERHSGVRSGGGGFVYLARTK